MKNEILETAEAIIDSFENDAIKQILIEEISCLDNLNSDGWAISLGGKTKFRLHFGPFIVFTIGPKRFWLPLDKNEYQKNTDLIKSTQVWSIDDNDYPQYIQFGLLSQNGYVSNQISKKRSEWETIRRFHYAFLEKIADKQYQLDPRTKKNHSIELNLYLKFLLSDDIPLPGYVSTAEEEPEHESEVIQPVDKSRIKFRTVEETERLSTVTVRMGQQLFRRNLLLIYKSCVLCGIENHSILKASHIKPWSKSSNSEKLDPSNGLLLCANHDALFDNGLISFSEDGSLKISDRISRKDLSKLGLINNRVEFDEETKVFIDWHREHIYKP